ncbi:hypothetical protein J6590_068674 [Homalodisca vitripennis]|nr:hypothetical protein J6590_068674 [Homalodisca vitripennis]
MKAYHILVTVKGTEGIIKYGDVTPRWDRQRETKLEEKKKSLEEKVDSLVINLETKVNKLEDGFAALENNLSKLEERLRRLESGETSIEPTQAEPTKKAEPSNDRAPGPRVLSANYVSWTVGCRRRAFSLCLRQQHQPIDGRHFSQSGDVVPNEPLQEFGTNIARLKHNKPTSSPTLKPQRSITQALEFKAVRQCVLGHGRVRAVEADDVCPPSVEEIIKSCEEKWHLQSKCLQIPEELKRVGRPSTKGPRYKENVIWEHVSTSIVW